MEEEQLELVEFVIRVELVNLVIPGTKVPVNLVNLVIPETKVPVNLVNLMSPETRVLANPVNLMAQETRALVNLKIDVPIADHNLYMSLLSDYTFKRTTLS
jgi:hypothetical protein